MSARITVRHNADPRLFPRMMQRLETGEHEVSVWRGQDLHQLVIMLD